MSQHDTDASPDDDAITMNCPRCRRPMRARGPVKGQLVYDCFQCGRWRIDDHGRFHLDPPVH